MRRAELLAKQARRATENEVVGSTDGISDEEVLQYFHDAQLCVQRRLMRLPGALFAGVHTWSADGSEKYDLPGLIFARQARLVLEWSRTGQEKDYQRLEPRTHHERFTYQGYPDRYILEGKQVIVNAYPKIGTFRLSYVKALPRIDKRRGTVASKATADGALTALTLAGATDEDFELFDHLTVVDFDGNVKMRGVPYTGVSSGVVAIQGSSYTYPEGSTIAVGDFVCLGEYASTHSELDDCCEDFLLAYCQKRILNRDSSQDAIEMSEEMQRMLMEIEDVYSDTGDVTQIPILQSEFFDDEGPF